LNSYAQSAPAGSGPSVASIGGIRAGGPVKVTDPVAHRRSGHVKVAAGN
jgi:hypothetical protein